MAVFKFVFLAVVVALKSPVRVSERLSQKEANLGFFQATRDQIVKETGNPTNVDYIAADLSVMKEPEPDKPEL
ncbi:hypothetical protein TELCIR_17401 [Teladorsagia circumcincta]|uniref:Uncharacterized protein n=1 Tax=Teladorsagia circumcincta TaxID=45464 RepID=A0A2G9TSX2_TELCI|nr:hypothetical protein TELCIR_17401 [Teladorsagia circumcincta]